MIITNTDTPTEQATVEAWLDRWKGKIDVVADNEGCGCCVKIWRVLAPREALDELPEVVLSSGEWSEAVEELRYERDDPDLNDAALTR